MRDHPSMATTYTEVDGVWRMPTTTDASSMNGTQLPSSTTNAKAIHDASTAADIRAALRELGEREATVTSRLDTLLATQKDLSRQLARLDLARATLGSQVIATRNISNGMLSSAAGTATRISASVRKLDREQAAVKATLEVVEQVAELKACVLGVHGSMGAPQDWETAASYLHRASKIPDAVVDGAFAEEIVPTAEVPDPPRVTLEHSAESLCALFLREFEKAAKDGDGARVTRFFKLFPMIGRSDVGLAAYGRYVCSGIAARARSNMNTAQRREGSFYANALTKLFEHIAQIVDGHEPVVERHYGAGSMVKVIERIQVEADVQGGIILDTWAEERRISRKLTDVKSYPFNFLVQSFLPSNKPSGPVSSRTGSPAPASGRASEDESVDMKDVDALLNESATMLGRWSLYTRFIASKSAATHEGSEEDVKLTLPSFVQHSTLQKKVSDLLIDPFNVLATFFFRRSVEKSFQLDEPPSGQLTLNPNKQLVGANPPFITSAVDDVMYIVNQVLQRTLATSQRSTIASVFPAVGRVLGSDFFGMVQRKMRDESYPKAAIQGALPPENVIISFLVLMNNLDVSTDYVKRIIRQCLGGQDSAHSHAHTDVPDDSPILDAFPFGSDAAFVTRTLCNTESAFEAKTSELLTEATEVMLKQVMRPRLRPVLIETFRDVNYDTGASSSSSDSSSHHHNPSDDFFDHHDADAHSTAAAPSSSAAAAAAADDPAALPHRFARGWHAFTLPLKRLLTPPLYARLLALTVSHLARTLEKRLWSYHGRVSPLGALRLERDIAGVINVAVRSGGGGAGAAGAGEWELRDLFARVTQMCLVMGMEEEEWTEMEAEMEREGGAEGGSGVVWKLEPGERRRVRGVVRGR